MLDPGYSYFVVIFLNHVQKVFDWILDSLFGLTTRYGWSKDRIKSRTDYETSAQLVGPQGKCLKNNCIFAAGGHCIVWNFS